MKNLLQPLKEKQTNSFSAIRVAFLSWIAAALVIWIYLSIIHKQMQEVDSSVIAILGILTSGKVIQRFGENNNNGYNNNGYSGNGN